ncbi:MAG: DUF819 family protein [Bacteroidota bacterium]
MVWTILQLILILFFPAAAILFSHSSSIGKWLSPVVLCYGIGIAIANVTDLPIDELISTQFSRISVLFAIPLLLFNTDLKAWLSHARTTVISFGLCVLSAVIANVTMAFLYNSAIEDTPLYAGMMLGLFTGGIPNMQAVGLMLDAQSEDFVLLNAADIFIGGCYLIFLTSVAHRVFSWFLPDFEPSEIQQKQQETKVIHRPQWQSYLLNFSLALLVVGAAVGVTKLLTGELEAAVLIILLLTTFSIVLSFIPFVRNLRGSFEMGEYGLLIFCVAIGLQADFTSIWEKGGMVILYMASVWGAIVVLHTMFARWFRIDRDTAMITATASIYGPVFVGQVASAINNRTLVFSGIATGLVGYALGNYLGVGLAYLLEMIFSN